MFLQGKLLNEEAVCFYKESYSTKKLYVSTRKVIKRRSCMFLQGKLLNEEAVCFYKESY